jgi:hypothetical protein
VATTPAIYVNTPALVPSRWGLFDAAETTPPEPRAVTSGVEFQPRCRNLAQVYADDCPPAVEGFDIDESAEGRPSVISLPMHLFAGFMCKSVGLTDDILRTEAEAALLATASQAIERYVWGPSESPAPGQPQLNQRLMDPDLTDILTPTAVSFTKGLRLLENHLYNQYGGVGVVHAPRGVSVEAAKTMQVRWENGKPVTTVGTKWSWGDYANTDVEGVDAAADTAWMVATGRVWWRQGPVRVDGDMTTGLNRETNDVLAIAKRSYVVSWECVQAAVLVTLT